MNCHPGGAPEAVADDVLDGHVSAEGRPVVDVGRLPEGTVRAAHVVVVAADHHGALAKIWEHGYAGS